MPSALSLLLRPGVLRSEQERPNRASRRPFGPKFQDRPRVAWEVEGGLSFLQPSSKLYTRLLSPATGTISQATYEPGLWTRYGRWDSSGTKVFNQRGELIYELPKANLSLRRRNGG